MTYDYYLEGTIEPAGDIDTFTFNGTAGDSIILRFNPAYPIDGVLELIYDGSLIAEDHAIAGGMAQLFDYVLPQTGEYVFYLRDEKGVETGMYWLTLQCRQDVNGKAVAIAYDTYIYDSLETVGDIDGYDFEGTAGDSMILRFNPANPIDGALELFYESALIDAGHATSGGRVDFIDYVLPYTGGYTFHVRDESGNETGVYGIILQCREDITSKATDLSYNIPVLDTLEKNGDIDGYLFEGYTGDTVSLLLNPASPVNGVVELFFNSTLKAEAHATNGANADIVDYVTGDMGAHVVHVRDEWGNKTGLYELTLDGCCEGSTGDIDCSGEEIPSITDITRLIDYLYISRRPLCCKAEADVNGTGGEPDITDVTRLIDYLYITHVPLAFCR
ncbi:MAG: hypothetical protein JXA92_11340 [candidate division Zixibacteria bacterium]|nr:hypothetical protein [candidate division Zixibacteria bacterium]